MAKNVKINRHGMPVGIIVLGPAPDMFPIVDDDHPKFTLPFLGTPLLVHSLEYILPVVSETFIVCLSRHRNIVREMIARYDADIEVFHTEEYEGISHTFRLLEHKIRSDHFLLLNGDIYFCDALRPVYERFATSGDDIHAFARSTDKEVPIMSIDSKNYLCGYNSDKIVFKRHDKIMMTTRYALYNFFLCKTNVLKSVQEEAFSFRSGLIPQFIKGSLKIKLFTSKSVQIDEPSDFFGQLGVEKSYSSSSSYYSSPLSPAEECEGKKDSCCSSRVMIGEQTRVDESAQIESSIIGSRCSVSCEAKITNSIILSDVEIGEKCVLVNCVVGIGAVVCDGCMLFNCSVGNRYVFDDSVEAEKTVFCCSDSGV